MTEQTSRIFASLGISLLLGLLVGLQRQHRQSLIAGLRTFPLITVLGSLAATCDQTLQAGYWITPSGFLGLTAIVAIGMAHELRRENADVGITTEAAILMMYLVGAYVVIGDRIVAIAVGAGVAILLQFKPELHGIASRLGDEDLRAIMTFSLITCIILPVLPNRTYDLVAPLDVLNPFEIWMMVVLMVGISLSGYLIYKFFGRTASLLLGGLLGGAISSTATTVSYARRARYSVDSLRLATVVVVIASTVSFARVILEIIVVAPRHWIALAPPVAVMMAASVATAGISWLRIRGATEPMPAQKNPTELKSALVFAAMYAGVLLALAATKSYVGSHGLYAVAAFSGLTDVDAMTLSASRLAALGPTAGGVETRLAWRLIVVALMANLCFKWGMCATLGNRRFALQVGALFAIPLLTGAGLLWFGEF
jgi:uncharacterized membrane protein (DUF4010 family)